MMIIFETIFYLSLLILAGYLLSESAETLAKRFGANFTGGVILALVTVMPEYMFVIYACLKEEYMVAVGSAVGAAAMLVTLGYGLVILSATTFSKKPVKEIVLSKKTRIDALYLLLTNIVALVLAIENRGFDVKDGLILISLFFLYVYHSYKAIGNVGEKETISKKDYIKSFLYLIIGAVLIITFTEPFVDSIIELSKELGVPAVALAILIAPIASEMPEKLTAFITVMRNGNLAEISISNFIGSKINHNSLLFGIIPLIGFINGDLNINVLNIQFLFMTFITFVTWISFSRGIIKRYQAFIFLLLYALVALVAFHSPTTFYL